MAKLCPRNYSTKYVCGNHYMHTAVIGEIEQQIRSICQLHIYLCSMQSNCSILKEKPELPGMRINY